MLIFHWKVFFPFQYTAFNTQSSSFSGWKCRSRWVVGTGVPWCEGEQSQCSLPAACVLSNGSRWTVLLSGLRACIRGACLRMHLNSSKLGVKFRKTYLEKVGPGEERWGRMLWCHMLCRRCRMEEAGGMLLGGIPCLNVLPKIGTDVKKTRDCSFSPTWCREGRDRSCFDLSLSIFCPYSLEKSSVNTHLLPSFQKPWLRLAAVMLLWALLRLLHAVFLNLWQVLWSHISGFCKAVVSVAPSTVSKGPEV